VTGEDAQNGFAASDRVVSESLVSLRVLCLFFLLVNILSALGVVYSSYKSRQLFSDVQQQHAQKLQLEEQWGRLLLEQSTWASHARIERLAKAKLSMVVPDPATIIVVKE
jgi:cell division protein FtsL